MSVQKKRKIVFIINPISGTQDKDSVIRQIEEGIDKDRIDWEIRYTEEAGHAVEIAAKAAKAGVDIVVAVGGDGTVNEVGRSLAETNTALGILPLGSGNGLARHLQIPMDTRKAIGVINEGLIEQVDYGKINGIPFFCICGVGFDAFISLKFAEAGKRGMLTYLEKTLQESLNYRPETYELETEDGKVKHKAFLIACGNASQYGNNAYITPKATITDGLLDVTILEPFTVLDIPSLAFQLFNKTIDYNSHIKTFKCKNLHIRRTEAGVVHFDGDPMITGTDIHIELIGKKLNMVVPPGKEKYATGMLSTAVDFFSGIRMINDAIVDDIVRKNKSLIKKLKKKE
ncbi:MAG: diacylglycerol kinase family lipid kinase [Mediterranea sp.]|jgi:YegS/Rv2252/BmrU family lipid kinase|nr:diacylglycerol kinase family lipid kinase [Mediterranea sp.]